MHVFAWGTRKGGLLLTLYLAPPVDGIQLFTLTRSVSSITMQHCLSYIVCGDVKAVTTSQHTERNEREKACFKAPPPFLMGLSASGFKAPHISHIYPRRFTCEERVRWPFPIGQQKVRWLLESWRRAFFPPYLKRSAEDPQLLGVHHQWAPHPPALCHGIYYVVGHLVLKKEQLVEKFGFVQYDSSRNNRVLDFG